ncbi:50S ribosomal protein L33 [Cokeromyces recurvatus]|uniref:50S ribosomal protein L33 n=1 Tax=Cokeromyces recurvatus TaxID=90255 RepID=UPI00221EA1B7|nr:50S ribosomal protein L33 [Cokeromyces recurvatus]KAI7907018.1 50S ribosomal protein L33 [Cokeromyces recurvatus]
MAKKAKARVILVKLLSTAGTGYNYIKSRPRIAPKLSMMKYDPVVKQHVLFTETKMKK